MEYTNGEKTGLNKYETKVSRNITMKGSKVRNGDSERSEVEQVVTDCKLSKYYSPLIFCEFI